MDNNLISIDKQDLLNLIHWARRYCDNRQTYAVSFNTIYERIRSDNPDFIRFDQFDKSLRFGGLNWPKASERYNLLTQCHKCHGESKYNERWDARHCLGCNIWLEGPCESPDCFYCVDRPEKPNE
jgi:hypothetical protein